MKQIIDSHFHVWRPKDNPWLEGPMVPRIFGPYESIKRDYLMPEYLSDISGSGIVKSVYVQTNWAKEDYEREAKWLSDLAAETGTPCGIVAFTDMSVPDAREQLDRLAKYPLVRGVRMQLHWHQNSNFRFAPSEGEVLSENVRKNVARLKDYGYSFDLQLFPSQMKMGAQLVRENPATNFIMTHAGMLTGHSAQEKEAWRQGLAEFAGLANFYTKLSGQGTFIHKVDKEFLEYVIGSCIEILGSSHLMFGSNFPVEKIWTDFPGLIETYKSIISARFPQAWDDIFWNTATKVYRV